MENQINDLGNGLYLIKTLPTQAQVDALEYAKVLAQLESQRKVIEAHQGILGFFNITQSVNAEVENEAHTPCSCKGVKTDSFWLGIFIAMLVLYFILAITTPKTNEG